MPSTSSTPVIASLEVPRERHDDHALQVLAPLVRALSFSAAVEAVWFSRVNKPRWGLRLHVRGATRWLEESGRALLLEGLGGEALFEETEPDDKWTGGREARERLEPFHHQDTAGCLEALAADRAGSLLSRSRHSARLIEGLLDLLAVRGPERVAFYRRSFECAIALGRWDREVFDALERTFAAQRPMLEALIESPAAEDDGGWAGPESARIGRALLHELRTVLTPSTDASSLALFAAHAHSNRLGIHGGREAALRYLVWRARDGWMPAP